MSIVTRQEKWHQDKAIGDSSLIIAPFRLPLRFGGICRSKAHHTRDSSRLRKNWVKQIHLDWLHNPMILPM